MHSANKRFSFNSLYGFSRIKVFLIVILNFFPLLFVYLKMAFNAVKAEATGALIDFIDEMIPALLQDFNVYENIVF